jgi:uncharacterized protein
MQWSNQTIIVAHDLSCGMQYLLYQTRTQALVKIEREIKELIDAFADPVMQERKERFAQEISDLHRLGLIVQDETEDMNRLKDFFQQLKYKTDRCFAVQILTTYACNFDCPYCFQRTTRRAQKMPVETQHQVIRWIQNRILRFGYQDCHLNFYGGEPLLNPDMIEYVADTMKGWCASRGIRFRFSLQTNGYLLTRQMVIRLKELGLSSMRISVDGPKDVHDRNRPLAGGGGTFERVIKNIRETADLVKIHISATYVDGNVEPIIALLDYLDVEGILHRLGDFLFAPAHAALGPKDKEEEVRAASCQCHHGDQQLEAATRRLNAVMESKGMPVKNRLSVTTCPLTRQNSGVTIDQEGRLYRCNSMIGHPKFSIGDVFHDDFNQQQAEFRDLDVWRQCPVDCRYLPICSGGCRLMGFLEHRNFRVPACKKSYLDRILPDMVRKEYLRQRTTQTVATAAV